MNCVFVFGSNLSGIHGAGAAKYAAERWGAVRGQGHGRTGNAYALPTKDAGLKTLSLDEIAMYYATFHEHVRNNPEINFLLTPFGTGLAGYQMHEIKALVEPHGLPRNLWLTGDWFDE